VEEEGEARRGVKMHNIGTVLCVGPHLRAYYFLLPPLSLWTSE
jgi:hypothetical protein